MLKDHSPKCSFRNCPNFGIQVRTKEEIGMGYTGPRILNKARTKCEHCGGKTFAYASYEIGPDANGDYYLCPDILCEECGEELE